MKKIWAQVVVAVMISMILQAIAGLVIFGSYREKMSILIKEHEELKRESQVHHDWITQKEGERNGREQARRWEDRYKQYGPDRRP